MALPRSRPPAHPTERILGTSPAIDALRDQIRRLAVFDALGSPLVPTVMLQGETGAGKGLVARVLHESGPRADGPFLEVNCAAIPEMLLEAELFGFEAGAFTDAKRPKAGLFEAASGGTLFLDEIDALSLLLQGKLLTAIEERRVRRVGSVVEKPVDLKLTVATNADLSARIAAGRFRADLYYRLAVVLLTVPPVRERGEDVLVLAQQFLRRYATGHRVLPKRLSRDAEAWLRRYPWPGNVRELSHLMERVMLLHPETLIDARTLEQLCLPSVQAPAHTEAESARSDQEPEDEPTQIRQALRRTEGNVAQAARVLGWSRKALRYRMQQYGIERPRPLKQHERLSGRPSPLPTLPHEGGRSAKIDPEGKGPTDALAASSLATTPADAPVPSWEQKPVAVLAIELTFPWHAGLEAIGYEPWTMAHSWEQRIVEKVRGFGGMLIQRSPSLLLVAFGVPQVVEQLPQRAVQAALVLRHLMTEVEGTEAKELVPVLRQAVHLGGALVGDRTREPAEQIMAVGDTLALPVRLLGQAAPGEIMLSPMLGRLVMGWCELQALPQPGQDGAASPVSAYRVGGLVSRRPAPVGARGPSSRPLVGRERELAALHELLAQVREGRGQAVGIVGDPGMGKSRLLSEFRQHLAGTGMMYLEGRCVSYGSTVPYLPVLDLLRDHCGIVETDTAAQVGARVRVTLQEVGMAPDEWMPYCLHLLGLPAGTDDLTEISPEALKRRTFEALQQMLLHASQRQPLILAVEDLQWIDPSSADFFAWLVECLAGASILFVATYRPGYRPPWLGQSYATQLSLPPLAPQESRRLMHEVCQAAALPEPIAQVILAKAQGNPFFLEEIVQALLDQSVAVRHPAAGTGDTSSATSTSLPGIWIPATVQGVLAARIDRLPAEAKALLQTLAVTGYACSFTLLTQLVDQPDGELHRLLAQLQGAEFIYEQPNAPDPVYIFKHALTRDMAYHMLSPVRRQALHERTAQAIEVLWSHRLEEQYAELAYHYSRSRNTAQAVTYLQRAGHQALECSAQVEAIAYLTRALELLQTLPTTAARCQQELVLQTTLGPALVAAKGFAAPDVDRTYGRAWELCQQVGETPELFPVLLGLRRWYFVRAEMDKARQLGEQLLALAERAHDSGCLLEAHRAVGTTLFFLGELASARAHLEQGITLYETHRQPAHAQLYGLDAGVTCLAHASHVLWALGYLDQARHRSDAGLALARGLTHPFSLAYALTHAVWLAQFCRESPAVQAQAEELIALSQAHSFPFRAAQGMLWRGWALVEQGQWEQGIAQMRQGLAAWQATGAKWGRPYFLALFAEAYGQAGQVDEGLKMLAEALEVVEQTGERYYEAELYRLRGELLLAHTATPREEVETCLHQALQIAHRQQAKSLELRAALSLSRLWQRQGEREAARRQLAEVYGWFTEGFDTADLQEARVLLETLARRRE